MSDELGDDLDPGPGLAHIEAHENVLLIDAGEGGKGVDLLNARLQQHALVGAVGMENGGLGQQSRELLTPRVVGLDDLDAQPRNKKLTGQIVGDAPAAYQNDLADGAGVQMHLPEEGVGVPEARHEADPVSGGKPELAGGNIDVLFSPLHGADQQLCPDKGGKLHQRPPLQNGTGGKLEGEQLHPSSGEGVGFDGRGNPQAPGNLRGAGHLRVDAEAQPQVIGDERQTFVVFGIPDPGDGVLGPQLFGDEAAQ